MIVFFFHLWYSVAEIFTNLSHGGHKMTAKILLFLLLIPAAFLAVTIAFLLLVSVSMLFIDPNRLYSRYNSYYRFLCNGTDLIIMVYSRVRVRLTGREKLPKDGKYLLVSNHLSGYDPLCTLYALRDENLIFISKPENFTIPVIGRLARANCFRPIDRENARNALVTIKDCAELLKAGVGPVVVYPEGTRSKTGELLPFHNSVFKTAQEANVPIVVMTAKGADKIRTNAPWRKTDVFLSILETLPAEHVKAERTAKLGEEIRAIMEQDLQAEMPHL